MKDILSLSKHGRQVCQMMNIMFYSINGGIMETTREQFDELMNFLKDLYKTDTQNRHNNKKIITMVEQIFPQFAQPKFRKCDLFWREESGGDVPKRRKLIDTTPFPIVVDDDENVYWIPKDKRYEIQKFNKDGYVYSMPQDSQEAQQILSFLEEE